MTRRVLAQHVAKWALLAVPIRGEGESDRAHMDACVAQAHQIAGDIRKLKAMGYDHGEAYCMALMVSGCEAGRLGGPFDGARGSRI